MRTPKQEHLRWPARRPSSSGHPFNSGAMLSVAVDAADCTRAQQAAARFGLLVIDCIELALTDWAHPFHVEVSETLMIISVCELGGLPFMCGRRIFPVLCRVTPFRGVGFSSQLTRHTVTPDPRPPVYRWSRTIWHVAESSMTSLQAQSHVSRGQRRQFTFQSSVLDRIGPVGWPDLCRKNDVAIAGQQLHLVLSHTPSDRDNQTRSDLLSVSCSCFTLPRRISLSWTLPKNVPGKGRSLVRTRNLWAITASWKHSRIAVRDRCVTRAHNCRWRLSSSSGELRSRAACGRIPC